jgi:retron-type reverse transcriptase
MNGHGKSDSPVVPGKQPNNGGDASSSAEAVEERGLAKGNVGQQNRNRTQNRESLQRELDRVRQVAERDKGVRFTTLWHHVYSIDRLREAYFALKHGSAAGVDGETWKHYGEGVEKNLEDLAGRLRRGAYRAKPVRRVYIPKDDGRQRPIGVPTLEDKIVQRATTEVLNAVYETDFLGFSYGFRPGRSQHNALDALAVGIEKRKVSWVLDADIRGFLDGATHYTTGSAACVPSWGFCRMVLLFNDFLRVS